MTAARTLPALLLGLVALTLAGCADGNFGEILFSGPGGFCWLAVVIADVWAFVKIANSHEDTLTKALWGALVFFFPVGGLLIWYFFGPKG